ncbi:MAG TPA: transporter substrate-binding domain-containing protein [Bdellovibrio sp.]|uniref:substrate-binding periplasmic protein n=1 Tax=Bdellovibrio sp. TaxID=28201 RepID=UPI002F16FA7D
MIYSVCGGRYSGDMRKIFFFFLICFASVAKSKDLDITVGLSDVAPFSYQENGVIQGLHYDIMKQIEEKSGLLFRYEIYPHARLAKALDNTSIDMTILFSEHCANSKGFEIQKDLYSLQPGLYVKKGVHKKLSELQIVLLRGTCTKLAEEIPTRDVYDVTNMEQAVRMLQEKHVDGFCGLGPVFRAALNDQKISLKVTLLQREKQKYTSVICRRKNLPDQIKKKLDKAAQNLQFKIPEE